MKLGKLVRSVVEAYQSYRCMVKQRQEEEEFERGVRFAMDHLAGGTMEVEQLLNHVEGARAFNHYGPFDEGVEYYITQERWSEWREFYGH